MRASFASDDQGLREAVDYINRQLNENEEFWRAIREKASFDFATIPPAEVERRVRSIDSTITIRLWKPKPRVAWKYRKTVAVTDGRYPRTLLYHIKFLGNDVGSKVNTIVHEYVHNVDLFDDGEPGGQMGHGDQDPTGKEESAPYWIGGLAERIYRAALGFAPSGEKAFDEPYRHMEIEVDEDDIVE